MGCYWTNITIYLALSLTRSFSQSLGGECLFAHLKFKLKNNKPNNGNWNEIYGRNYVKSFFPLHIIQRRRRWFPWAIMLFTSYHCHCWLVCNVEHDKKSQWWRAQKKSERKNEALDKFLWLFPSPMFSSTRELFYCHLFNNEFSLSLYSKNHPRRSTRSSAQLYRNKYFHDIHEYSMLGRL